MAGGGSPKCMETEKRQKPLKCIIVTKVTMELMFKVVIKDRCGFISISESHAGADHDDTEYNQRFVKSKRGFVDDDMCKYLRGMLNSIHANADAPEVFQANLQHVKSLTQSLKPTFTPI